MSYPSGDQGYYSAERAGGYGAYPPQSAKYDRSPPLHRYLGLAVVALGLASYLVSYGPVLGVGGIGWDVRFAVLAGLLAVFGLTPQQTPNTKAIAALAVAGFLDALSSLITAPDESHPGWALTVIVVLNGLQAAAAIGALVLQAGAVGERASRHYDAYADYYAQAAEYYGQYAQQQSPPEEVRRSGMAQAQQTHQVTARQPHQAAASQAGSYAEYVGNYGADQTSGAGRAPARPDQQAAPTGPQAGLPSFGQAQAPAQQHGGSAQPEQRPTAPY